MSQILQQVEQLRQQAIALLLSERETIEQKLNQLGFDGQQKNGRSKKCSRCGQEGHNAKTCPSPSETSE